MTMVRLTKALFCGACASTVLWLCDFMFRPTWDQVAQLVREIRRLPSIARWVEFILPDQQWCLIAGLLLFGIGVSWLAWLNEPSALLCTVLGLGLFAFAVVLSTMAPLIQIIQGTVEWREGDRLLPWMTHYLDLPWLLLCSLPLVIAGMVWTRGNRAVASNVSGGEAMH